MDAPVLCLVTDREATRAPLEEVVETVVAAGVDQLQVRDRALGGAALLEHVEALATAAARGARARGGTVRVVVNKRCDIALAACLDGVHLGGDALPPGEARGLLGAEAWIGVSCHAPGEVAAAREGGASYAHLAPIAAPRSKPGTRPPLGLAALEEASRAGLPVLAQGGIDAALARACVEAGATGVAVTGALLHAEEPAAAAAALRAALDEAAKGRNAVGRSEQA